MGPCRYVPIQHDDVKSDLKRKLRQYIVKTESCRRFGGVSDKKKRIVVGKDCQGNGSLSSLSPCCMELL